MMSLGLTKCCRLILFKNELCRVMLSSSVEKIRNVGIVAHIDAGKTTTSEQFLYWSGETNAVGRVDNGNTVMDYLPQERERGITIGSAAVSFEWDECHVNLIDTPGHVDFTIEVERSVRAMDSAIVIVDALAGVQAQVLNQELSCVAFINKMDRDGADFFHAVGTLQSKLQIMAVPIQLPLMVNDSFRGIIDLVRMCVTFWDHNNGHANAQYETNHKSITPCHEFYEEAFVARTKMVESIADVDDDFLEIALGSSIEHIQESDIIDALRRCCVSRLLVPALCGSSLKSKGVEPLLYSISQYLPSPLDRPTYRVRHVMENNFISIVGGVDLLAFAFKVIVDPKRGPLVFVRVLSGEILSKGSILWNSSQGKVERPNQLLKVSADDLIGTEVIGRGDIGCIVGLKHTSTGDTLVLKKGPMECYVLNGLQIPDPVFSMAIEPEKSSQYDSLIKSLTALALEDPSLKYEVNEENGQLLLHGIGELHLEIVCDKLSRQYHIPVEVGQVQVMYRESIPCGKFIEQDNFISDRIIGGKHYFSKISGSIKHDSTAFTPSFVIDTDVRKNMSNEEYFALTDGLQKSFLMGPQGFPLASLIVHISAVSFNSSNSVGSIRAGVSNFMLNNLQSVKSVVLEPHMSLQIDAPAEYVGDILSDLTVKRRATIQSVENTSDQMSVIFGEVPFSTMLGYASTVRSLSQGQGSFSMEYHNHQVTTAGDK